MTGDERDPAVEAWRSLGSCCFNVGKPGCECPPSRKTLLRLPDDFDGRAVFAAFSRGKQVRYHVDKQPLRWEGDDS